jgi:Protein of unknown function (DUF732)
MFGDVDLGQSSFSAKLPQHSTKLLVLLRVDGFLHPASAPCTSLYPNLGYFGTKHLAPGGVNESQQSVMCVMAPMTRLLAAALLVASVLNPAVASAYPVCGAHSSPAECAASNSPTPDEQTFLSHVAPAFPGIPAMTLVREARATCDMLAGGEVTHDVVRFLAGKLGTSMGSAGQFMDAAMVADCPNLHVGADGVAR